MSRCFNKACPKVNFNYCLIPHSFNGSNLKFWCVFSFFPSQHSWIHQWLWLALFSWVYSISRAIFTKCHILDDVRWQNLFSQSSGGWKNETKLLVRSCPSNAFREFLNLHSFYFVLSSSWCFLACHISIISASAFMFSSLSVSVFTRASYKSNNHFLQSWFFALTPSF